MLNVTYVIWSIHTETMNKFYVVHRASRTIHSICKTIEDAIKISKELNLTASNIANKVI